MSKGRSLKKEITLLLMLVSLLPIIGLGVGTFYTLSGSVRSDFNLIIQNSLGRVSQVLIDNYNANSTTVNYLTLDPNARNIFKDESNREVFHKDLESFMSSSPNIANVYVGLEDGSVIMGSGGKVSDGFDPRQREWYKKALESSDKAIMADPYKDAVTGETIITFAKTVKDYNGKTIGVLGMDVKVKYITDIVSKVNLGENGFSGVISRQGVIIAHKDPKLIGKTVKEESWIEDAMKLNDLQPKVMKIEDESYILFKSTDKESGLIALGFVPEKEVVNVVKVAMLVPGIVFIVALVIIIIASTLFSSNLGKPIKKIEAVLNSVKNGDFTKKAETNKRYCNEMNGMILSVNTVIDDMVHLLSDVQHTSDKVRDSSETLSVITTESSKVGEEVARAVQQIAEGATNQADELNESVVIATNLGNEVNNSIKNSDKMLDASKQVRESTDEGMKAIRELKENYMKNEEANQKVSEKVNIVTQRSNEISTITDTIKAITEQTNLLALNASIEAARAGEAGRGFAVVAEEVRKLAEESVKSAEEISGVVSDIKQSVKELYDQTLITKELNDKTSQSVEITDEKFNYIANMINELEEDIGKVSDALKEINKNKDVVISNISEVATVSEETAATTEEVSASSEEQSSALQEISEQAQALKNHSEGLDDLVKRFKIR